MDVFWLRMNIISLSFSWNKNEGVFRHSNYRIHRHHNSSTSCRRQSSERERWGKNKTILEMSLELNVMLKIANRQWKVAIRICSALWYDCFLMKNPDQRKIFILTVIYLTVTYNFFPKLATSRLKSFEQKRWARDETILEMGRGVSTWSIIKIVFMVFSDRGEQYLPAAFYIIKKYHS